MSGPLRIRLGGYSPKGSTHSDALDRISSTLRDQMADVDVEIDYNCLDSGWQVRQLLDQVESGELTACYISTSYLVERVPELGIVDLPFVFESLDHAHRSLDGEFGRVLSERTEALTPLASLGYWDNGVRHLSNRIRPIRSAADCAGLRIRLQPNWAHEHFFQELGTMPVLADLLQGVELIQRGEVDAQENPLANFVAYGVDRVHPYLTLTGHAYGARGVYANASELRDWPDEARSALGRAVSAAATAQRCAAEAKELELRSSLEAAGTQILELEPAGLEGFQAAAAHVLTEARARLGEDVFELLEG